MDINIISQQYKKDNYRIIKTKGDKKKCIIFCSSNGLVKGNDDNLTNFYNQIVINDRYEWENIATNSSIHKKYGTILFLRDIYERFYVNGINERINNIDLIIELLSNIVGGKSLTIVGYSAGGYLACLLGIRLKAERIFAFGGVVNLYTWGGSNDDYTYKDNKVLVANEIYPQKRKYYNIAKLISQSSVPIYYYYSGKCVPDCRQYDEIKNHGHVRGIAINSNKHGSTVYPVNYIDMFLLENEKLDFINNSFKDKELVDKVEYSIKISGYTKTYKAVLKEKIKKILGYK